MDDKDLSYLRRCVDLAAEAVDAGDQPFGSILVSAEGETLFEDRNRVGGGDATRHPEFAIVRWAAQHLSAEARRSATVYTSGEHCAMCAAAHCLAGMGRIVYAKSTDQLIAWREELGRPSLGIVPLRIADVVPGAQVEGPVAAFAAEVRALHARAAARENRHRTWFRLPARSARHSSRSRRPWSTRSADRLPRATRSGRARAAARDAPAP
jgi:tRNA(Arg) A34 adenosine deaminase TadA